MCAYGPSLGGSASSSVSEDLGALGRTAEPGGKRQSTEETVECVEVQQQCDVEQRELGGSIGLGSGSQGFGLG